MRKVLIPALLLAVSMVLGATVFREQIARAAPPITNVFVTNTPDPWQQLVSLPFEPGGQFASAFFQVPEDRAITIEKVGVPDFFGHAFKSVLVSELCDFSEGQSGLGGFTAVPQEAKRPEANLAVDHLTVLHLTPGACYEVILVLAEPLGPEVSGQTTVTLSGTQIPAAAPASVASVPLSERHGRSQQDPAYQSLLRGMDIPLR